MAVHQVFIITRSRKLSKMTNVFQPDNSTPLRRAAGDYFSSPAHPKSKCQNFNNYKCRYWTLNTKEILKDFVETILWKKWVKLIWYCKCTKIHIRRHFWHELLVNWHLRTEQMYSTPISYITHFPKTSILHLSLILMPFYCIYAQSTKLVE